ncbi:MAG: hypothetical protein ACKO0Z_10925 [Betaproteobacteria bacterium]
MQFLALPLLAAITLAGGGRAKGLVWDLRARGEGFTTAGAVLCGHQVSPYETRMEPAAGEGTI